MPQLETPQCHNEDTAQPQKKIPALTVIKRNFTPEIPSSLNTGLLSHLLMCVSDLGAFSDHCSLLGWRESPPPLGPGCPHSTDWRAGRSAVDPRKGALVHRARGTTAGLGWGTNLGTCSHSCAILPRAQCHSSHVPSHSIQLRPCRCTGNWPSYKLTASWHSFN